MSLSNSFFGVGEDDQHFNLDAAIEAYERILGMEDDEARAFASTVVFDGYTADLEANKERLQADLDAMVAKRAEGLRHKLGQSYITKRAGGEPGQHLLAAAGAIAKAVGDYTPEERRLNVARQTRDRGGRFSSMNRKIAYGTRDSALKPGEAVRLGVPQAQLDALDKDQRKKFQEAYLQVQDLLGKELVGLPENSLIINYNYMKDDGKRFTIPSLAGTPSINEQVFADGGQLTSVDVKVANDLNVNGAGYDLLAGVGGAQFGALGSYVAPRSGAGVDTFADEWTTQQGTDVGNNNGLYRRIGAASRLVDSLLPDSYVKTKLAVALGSWVGQYGPQAEKVIGPGMRKTTYRYRGVERKPDEGLVSIVENSPRERVLFPTKSEGTKGQRVISIENESPVIQYFVSRLPKTELYTLQRKSGNIPPSEGIIIDRNGTVVTQAVGYGDDWYLPFNLKNIGKLQGGEYIRTRAIGGPTTEDIYTGLISGARRVTVVSRSGVFTVEFDESFRGTRRYSDKAGRMVTRYGQLLDAVDKGNITPATVPGEKIAEFKAKGEELYGDDDGAIEAYVERMKAKEMANPRLSEAKKAQIKAEVIGDAAARMQTADGMPMRGDEFVRQLAARELSDMLRSNPEIFGSMDSAAQSDYVRQMTKVLNSNPDRILAAAGLAEEAETRIAREEAAYKATLRPLKLDGQGYAFALEALREQFPYYIKSVKDRPVRELGGVAQGTNARDEGYIKPKFIRPAGVEMGYFDESINGAGKITGDQAYYQNGNTTPRPIRRYESAPERVRESMTTSTGAPASGDRLSDAMAAVEMVTHMRSLASRPGATLNGRELPANTKLSSSEELQRLFPTLFVTPEAEIRAAMGNPNSGMRGRIINELNKFKADYPGVVDIDPNIEAAFRGDAVPTRPFSVFAALSDSESDFDFGDPAFEPNRPVSQYKARYDSPGPMANIRQKLELGEIDDPGNDAKIANALETLRRDRLAQEKWEAGPKNMPAPIKDTKLFETTVKHTMQAKMLIRRYRVESAAQAAAPRSFDGDITQVLTQVADGSYRLMQQEGAGAPVQSTTVPAGSSPFDIQQAMTDFADSKIKKP